MPEFPTKVYFVGALLRVVAILLVVPQFGAHGMAALLSVFFISTTTVLVWKTLAELQRAQERQPSAQVGTT
jgi:O-antigen/teichoic acid export membrane protein